MKQTKNKNIIKLLVKLNKTFEVDGGANITRIKFVLNSAKYKKTKMKKINEFALICSQFFYI